MPNPPKPIPPDRTGEQRKHALVIANDIRVKRAIWRETIESCEPQEAADLVAEVLASPAAPLATMHVHALLQWVPRLGPVRIGRVVNPRKRVDGLSDGQRASLVRLLRSGEIFAYSRLPEGVAILPSTTPDTRRGEILRLRTKGYTYRRIGTVMGISGQRVNQIVRRCQSASPSGSAGTDGEPPVEVSSGAAGPSVTPLRSPTSAGGPSTANTIPEGT